MLTKEKSEVEIIWQKLWEIVNQVSTRSYMDAFSGQGASGCIPTIFTLLKVFWHWSYGKV